MNTIGIHLQSPDVTFLEHVRKYEHELGETIAHRKPIYLDTKFWIMLRDANRQKDGSRAAILLALLRRAVSESKVFCPISSATFIELMRQDCLSSRIETAKIVDELSLGLTIVGFEERIAVEIEHLIRLSANLNRKVVVGHAVWRKLSYVLGLMNLQNAALEREEDLAIQKAFFDHMCSHSLLEMVKIIGDGWVSDANDASLVSSINEQIAVHADELRSFEQAYAAEARGVVDEMGEMTLDIVRSVAREYQEVFEALDNDEEKKAKNRWKNLLYLALVKNRARSNLPTLHIRTSLYASLRWDKKRKLRPNDLWDFAHAEAGVGYCSAFFTEKSLHNMVTGRHLGLDHLYECRVVSSVEDANEYVSSILHPKPGPTGWRV